MNISQQLASVAKLLALVAITSSAAASAQTFPSKPFRVIVPFAPGGIVDVTARQVSQKMSDILGQPFVVDNRAGAGGVVGTEAVAKSPADGHTLLMAFDTHAVNPLIYKSLNFDTFKDFAPISLIAHVPLLFATTPRFPANDVKSFIQRAKEKPGSISYGSVGAGSSGHLAAEQLKVLTKTEMVHAPFKGGAPALTALMGEQIQLLVFAAGAAVPMVQAGKVKGLAVTGNRRAAALPGVPTMAESGFPQFGSGAWMGLLAPAGTPAGAIATLHTALEKAVADPAVVSSLSSQAVELTASSPAEFGRFIRSEHDKWKKLIADANLDIRQ